MHISKYLIHCVNGHSGCSSLQKVSWTTYSLIVMFHLHFGNFLQIYIKQGFIQDFSVGVGKMLHMEPAVFSIVCLEEF